MRAHASQASADGGTDRTLAAFLRIPRPLFDVVFGREWFVDPAHPPGAPVSTGHLCGAAMSAQNPMMASATQNDSSLPRWKPSARQVIQGLLGLSLAVALLVWGLPFFVGTTWAEVFDKLRQIGPSTALQLLAVMISGLWLYTFMLTGSLPGLSHPKALILNVSSSSVGNLLPGGGAAGVAATYGMCRSWGFSRRDISTSVIVSGVWNVLGRVALPVIGTGVLLTDASKLPGPVVRGGAIGGVVGVVLLGSFIAVIVSARAATVIGRGLDKALNPLWRRSRASQGLGIDELVHDLRGRLNSVVRSGWPSMTFGLSGFFGVYYVLFWFCLDAAHVHRDFRAHVCRVCRRTAPLHRRLHPGWHRGHRAS